ncbi:MAG: hypothetical protein JXO44_06465 [Clostridia bacterium]|nr:hypothetical protein [Clostridia bacterium]
MERLETIMRDRLEKTAYFLEAVGMVDKELLEMSANIKFDYSMNCEDEKHYEFIIDGKSICFEKDSLIKTVHSKRLEDYKGAIYDRIRAEITL